MNMNMVFNQINQKSTKEKVSGPNPLNHNHIHYSDIKILKFDTDEIGTVDLFFFFILILYTYIDIYQIAVSCTKYLHPYGYIRYFFCSDNVM